ncbi:MAG: KH domain-containing protein [Candidatus Promineifilaceae bacterium]
MFKDTVEFIVKSLVDHPDDVEVHQDGSASSIILEVTVNEDDTGRVIGRGGRVINAIRVVIQSLAARDGKRVSLEVMSD